MSKHVLLVYFLQALMVLAHQHGHSQTVLEDSELPIPGSPNDYNAKYGPQIDLPFTGPLSFAHLPYARCLDDQKQEAPFDIAILGMPFDTAVSYRPGARFGPSGIRSGSRRLRTERGYSLAWQDTPYASNGTVVIDCGDVGIHLNLSSVPLPLKASISPGTRDSI